MIDDCVAPSSYARRLATYIRCPSTIRARTFDQFGHGPSLERCRKYRDEVEQRELRDRTHMENRAWDCKRTFACGHPRNAENTIERDGRDRCLTCRREVERKAAERYRAKEPKAIERLSLAPYVERECTGYLTAGELVSFTATLFNTTAADLLGPSRFREHVIARAALVTVLRTERKMSYPSIGRLLSRDHSTVINAAQKLTRYRQESPLVDEAIGSLVEAARRTR